VCVCVSQFVAERSAFLLTDQEDETEGLQREGLERERQEMDRSEREGVKRLFFV
jgi:hypothetical protein